MANIESLPAWIVCVLITFGLYFLSLVAEFFWARRTGKKIYSLRNSITNSMILIGFAVITGVWSNLFILKFYQWLHLFAPWHLAESWLTAPASVPLWQFAALFLFDDFSFYVYHRLSHASKLGWAMHETHHSSNFYNLTVSGREPWTAILVAFIFWAPLVLIGFDPLLVITQQWISLSYQLFIHTSLIGKLGPLELIFNTPSHHRVHHGLNEQYLDKNFGGILIIWDRIFGTFEPEFEPVRYGISPSLESHSPLRVVFNGFINLFTMSRHRELNAEFLLGQPIDKPSAKKIV